MSTKIRALILVAFLGACDRGGLDSGGGGGGDDDVESVVNMNLVLPAGSYDVSTMPGEDTTITTTGGGDAVDVMPGVMNTVTIPFTAPMGNVVGGAIRFGTTGPVHVIPVAGASGMTSGSVSFQFMIPQSVCDMLGSVCHSIKCYEFAVTSAGTFSRANITQVAMACNNCSEPSCQDLLMSCQVSQCSNGDFMCGDGSCIPPSSVCNNASDCPDGSDEDQTLCGTPGSCCVATNGCPEETGTSCASTCCCCGAGEKCCADKSGCCAAP